MKNIYLHFCIIQWFFFSRRVLADTVCGVTANSQMRSQREESFFFFTYYFRRCDCCHGENNRLCTLRVCVCVCAVRDWRKARLVTLGRGRWVRVASVVSVLGLEALPASACSIKRPEREARLSVNSGRIWMTHVRNSHNILYICSWQSVITGQEVKLMGSFTHSLIPF